MKMVKVGLALWLGMLCANLYAKDSNSLIWFASAGEGIYQAEFDFSDGSMSEPRQVVAGVNSDYLVQHPSLPVLYAINRESEGGHIAAYYIGIDGSLALMSKLEGRPKDGAHITVNKEGTMLAVAYYTGGSTGIYALEKDGSIGKVILENQHEGSSVNKARQEAAHPHWVGFSDDSRFLYVPDLGTDHIWVYSVDARKQKAKLAHKVPVAAGSGPRHMAFHPEKNWAYVSDELLAKVSVFEVDTRSGELTHLQTLDSAEEGKDELWANVSDIRVHPDGRFVYVVNRGLDRVSVFAVDAEKGTLSPVEREPVRGSISRNIVITEDGKWAIVAAVKSNTVAVYEVDENTGEMRFLYDHLYKVPNARAIVIDGYVN